MPGFSTDTGDPVLKAIFYDFVLLIQDRAGWFAVQHRLNGIISRHRKAGAYPSMVRLPIKRIGQQSFVYLAITAATFELKSDSPIGIIGGRYH